MWANLRHLKRRCGHPYRTLSGQWKTVWAINGHSKGQCGLQPAHLAQWTVVHFHCVFCGPAPSAQHPRMQLNTPLHRLRRQYPVKELDARREATLQGDCSGDLCCELTDSLLLELSEKLQMSPAPGHTPRPLVLFRLRLARETHELAAGAPFLRDVARLEVRAVARDGGTLFESAFKFVFVDEAHCVADHGHDFRPEYLLIGRVVAAFRSHLTLLLLTATATAPPAVVRAISRLVRTTAAPMVIRAPTGSFRGQMTYTQQPVHSALHRRDALNQLLHERRGQCGIVYCGTRKQCEQSAREHTMRYGAETWANGQYDVAFFHAGMTTDQQTGTQADFLAGCVSLIFAPIAWGMGMDRLVARPPTFKRWGEKSDRMKFTTLYEVHDAAAEFRVKFSQNDKPTRKVLKEPLPAKSKALRACHPSFFTSTCPFHTRASEDLPCGGPPKSLS